MLPSVINVIGLLKYRLSVAQCSDKLVRGIERLTYAPDDFVAADKSVGAAPQFDIRVLAFGQQRQRVTA